MTSNTKNTLSRDTINALVRAHFGDTAQVRDVTEITEGCFNAIYILQFEQPVAGYSEVVLKTGVASDKYILTYEKEIMRAEIQVYGLISQTEIPTPRIICHDFTHERINCDYFFMEKLVGPVWEDMKEKLTPENTARLQYELGRYAAMFHTVKGNYFGYIKEDESYRFGTWREAFRSFVDNIIADGRRDGIRLPYIKVMKTLEPLWPVLDDVTEPALINFDLWGKNILLAEKDGAFVIDGVIDHERAFFGDPVAEFISTSFICGDLEKADDFRRGYTSVSGKPFAFSREEQIRYWMYSVYMGLLLGVEVYRYEKPERIYFLGISRHILHHGLAKLKSLSKTNRH